MPAKRLSVRKITEILRLRHEAGLSNRQITRSCCVGRTTVAEYVSRAAAAGLTWPLPEGMDEARLERLLFPPPPLIAPSERSLPDWSEIHTELKRKGVTLALLWEEYKAQHPADGYQYSRFCDLYRAWRGKLDLCMRHEHRAGEKMFIDYCGQTVPVIDPQTGQIREAQIFVAVLGASNYTYAEATWTQSLPDWVASHQRCSSQRLGTFDSVAWGSPSTTSRLPFSDESGYSTLPREERCICLASCDIFKRKIRRQGATQSSKESNRRTEC